MTTLAIFGIDVGDLVADLIRSLLDLLVPDFAGRWATRLVSWLVALPNVTDWRHFSDLNAFRRELTHVAWGILSLSFVCGGLQYWAAGFSDAGRAGAVDAARRALIAAAGLAAYPTLVGSLVLAVNHLTAAMVRHPEVADGLDKAIGGAFAIGVVSAGLTLGLAVGAVLAALFFLAAIMVMKIALTAMLCVLLVSGCLVIALYPLPQGDAIARLWLSGLLCAVVVPVSWAIIFAVAGLVSSDALVWGGGLGKGLETVVKPFVAVACFYLAYRAPGFLLMQARMMGLRLDAPGLRGAAPGERRLQSSVRQHAGAHRERFAALGALAARPAGAGAGAVAQHVARQTAGARRVARRIGAAGAVNLAASASGRGERAERAAAGVVAVAGVARAGASAGRRVGQAAQRAGDWWRAPGARPDGGRPDRAPDRPRGAGTPKSSQHAAGPSRRPDAAPAPLPGWAPRAVPTSGRDRPPNSPAAAAPTVEPAPSDERRAGLRRRVRVVSPPAMRPDSEGEPPKDPQ